MKHNWKWNSSSSTLFIELHWYIPHFTLSSRQKLHFMTVKRSSSSYKQKSLQIFSGKKPHLNPIFTVFKLQPQTPWAALQTLDPSVPQRFRFFYVFTNYWVIDRSFGSISSLPFMLSFLSLVLLALVRPAPKCSATPSRRSNPTNPLGPFANTPECIIHWICITKQSSILYYWNG